ncbi:hypothetical protein Q8W40_01260 [Vibrio penaeicida]|nr:hypothetical protein [Vibrio penaeicida]MDP2570793.1 hypothetical protein [Vibrio penaeicida]
MSRQDGTGGAGNIFVLSTFENVFCVVSKEKRVGLEMSYSF